MLGPATVTVAAHLGTTGDWILGAAHTMRSNLLNQPAGVVPVGRIKHPHQSEKAVITTIARPRDLRAGSEGLPIAVQITGRPWQENRCWLPYRPLKKDLGLSHLPVAPRA